VRQTPVLGEQGGGGPITESGTVVAFPTPAGTKEDREQPARREYLTEREVEQLCDAARKRGRYGHRDTTMILMAYRHGVRVSELIELRWEQVDLEAGRLQVIRRKGSDGSVQPLSGVEIRALRRVKREQEPGSRHVFLTERGAPMTANGFFKMLSRAAESIGMEGVHPHLLRHACGFKLVNQGVDTRTLAAYLGHRQIANTARYTKDGCAPLRWLLAGLSGPPERAWRPSGSGKALGRGGVRWRNATRLAGRRWDMAWATPIVATPTRQGRSLDRECADGLNRLSIAPDYNSRVYSIAAKLRGGVGLAPSNRPRRRRPPHAVQMVGGPERRRHGGADRGGRTTALTC
jgi:integrase-like protein